MHRKEEGAQRGRGEPGPEPSRKNEKRSQVKEVWGGRRGRAFLPVLIPTPWNMSIYPNQQPIHPHQPCAYILTVRLYTNQQLSWSPSTPDRWMGTIRKGLTHRLKGGKGRWCWTTLKTSGKHPPGGVGAVLRKQNSVRLIPTCLCRSVGNTPV